MVGVNADIAVQAAEQGLGQMGGLPMQVWFTETLTHLVKRSLRHPDLPAGEAGRAGRKMRPTGAVWS